MRGAQNKKEGPPLTVKTNENRAKACQGCEITPIQPNHALHSCPAAPQGANPIGWVTTSKGGASYVHSGNELAVWEWVVGGEQLGGAGLCPT